MNFSSQETGDTCAVNCRFKHSTTFLTPLYVSSRTFTRKKLTYLTLTLTWHHRHVLQVKVILDGVKYPPHVNVSLLTVGWRPTPSDLYTRNSVQCSSFSGFLGERWKTSSGKHRWSYNGRVLPTYTSANHRRNGKKSIATETARAA